MMKQKMHLFVVGLILFIHVGLIHCFTDDYLFSVNWPGNAKSFPNIHNYESIIMKSKDDETFECLVPLKPVTKNEQPQELHSKGPSPLELLKPLLEQTSCSYKIDSYWSYEICHRRHVRQFHEEKMSEKENKVTEYYLGYYRKHENVAEDAVTESPVVEENVKESESLGKPEETVVEGQTYPYYKMEMKDGTVCDVTQKPREIHLLFICIPDGNGEIYEITEYMSCKYRAVILTKYLCEHPLYKPKQTQVNGIHCYPKDSTSKQKKPVSLMRLEKDKKDELLGQVSNLEGLFGADTEVNIMHKGDKMIIAVQKKSKDSPKPMEQPHVKPTFPEVTTQEFFSGQVCFNGGSTWWKHEVCFRKRVYQFHVHEDGSRTEINLGHWDEKAHAAWVMESPETRMPDASAEKRTELLQFYSNGDLCDDKEPRHVILKLRCSTDSPTAVTISFAEHKTCRYTLTLEGIMLCPLIQVADSKTGIVPSDHVFDEASSTPQP